MQEGNTILEKMALDWVDLEQTTTYGTLLSSFPNNSNFELYNKFSTFKKKG